MPQRTDKTSTAAGIAALTICESLLLALREQNVLRDNDVRGILEDAAATNRGAADMSSDDTVHKAAAELIEHLLTEQMPSPPR